MIAIDTNVLVRFVAKDDPVQAEISAGIIRDDDVFIPRTVFLEAEWVLRYVYKFKSDDILQAFKTVLGLRNIFTDDFHVLADAISFSEEGLDFADSMHLASSKSTGEFVTFDKSLVKKASSKVASRKVSLAGKRTRG